MGQIPRSKGKCKNETEVGESTHMVRRVIGCNVFSGSFLLPPSQAHRIMARDWKINSKRFIRKRSRKPTHNSEQSWKMNTRNGFSNEKP
jgi:hypothetical protein